MDRNSVNREEQGSQVLSVRLSSREFRHLQETLRNLGIKKGSLSASVRVLFEKDLYRSRILRRKREQLSKLY
jgi:hypothetical protein